MECSHNFSLTLELSFLSQRALKDDFMIRLPMSQNIKFIRIAPRANYLSLIMFTLLECQTFKFPTLTYTDTIVSLVYPA
jgi:hypothetical protein